jgi:diaminohydroxyphosphoribosylaminopyrimidine deaminase/5-amino-6-(5-phosphoribosylamino)uracil reductase
MNRSTDEDYIRRALSLARRAYGETSPNPMVGAILVRAGKVIGQGWHHRAGLPHAEIEALRAAAAKGFESKGATLYVTLEPCCTQGRTPPCTQAILEAGIKKVVVGSLDPNPRHCGAGLEILKRAGVRVVHGMLALDCQSLNVAFNHWIVKRTPLVTVKAAMTLDGKIATAAGESKWITADQSRNYAMRLRQGADAILVGINTVLEDDPSLTVRIGSRSGKALRRVILDSLARTPLSARIITDDLAPLTTIVVSREAPQKRVAALGKRVNVWQAPSKSSGRAKGAGHLLNLSWVLKKLASANVTSLLVEGGGEVNASFLLGGLAHRIAFFYAPKILGGSDSRKAVAGPGAQSLQDAPGLTDVHWRRLGPDWLLTARVTPAGNEAQLWGR